MGALRAARSQLAAERTPDSSGGAAPPVAEQVGGCTAARRQAVSLAALTATHCRSLCRGGPRWFAGGGWIHRRGGAATAQGWATPRTGHPEGGRTTPKTGHPEGGGLRQW